MVHACVNGACTHTYWPNFVCFHKNCHFLYEKCCTFHEKYVKSIENIWKATKAADSTQVSHFDLVFHRVQREGQLGICYILVIFGGICIHTYWPGLVCFHEKWHFFVWKVLLFMKSTWKGLKSTWKTSEKQQKHPIQHRSLILTWSFIEYRVKAN